MSVGMMIRALSTLILYPMATKLYSISKVLQLFTIASLVAMVFYIPSDTYTVLLMVTILFSAVYPNLMPGMESSATLLVRKDRIHYGKARAYGSLGYTVALLVVGAATSQFGNDAVLYVMLTGLTLMVFTQFIRIPNALRVKPEQLDAQQESYTYVDLFKVKGFLIVIVVAIFLQAAHATYYNYAYIYLEDLKINAFQIGLILNVAVIIEIIFFAQADKVFGRLKVSTMYLIAGIGSTIRWGLIIIYPSVTLFIVSQLLHAVSFGVAHYAFMKYLSTRLKPGLVPLAQGVYSAVAMSLSVAVLTILGGFLYEIKPAYAFAAMFICSIPAVLITFISKKKYNY